MDNNIDIDLIINRQKYSQIYNFTLILTIILIVILYIIFTYKYQTYYQLKGKMIDNKIELLVPIKEISMIQKNNALIIDDTSYSYQIVHISNELYIDPNYQNYCYLYLKVTNLENIDNFVYDIKIPKENKILAKYLKDYM